MTLNELSKFQEKMIRMEYTRLISLGYTHGDAQELANDGIDRGFTQLLLLQILKEVKKK